MDKTLTPRFLPAVLGALLLVPGALALAYALKVTSGVPLADEWRWIRHLLLPLVRGELSFAAYLTGEYAFLGHTHFLTLGALLLDYRLAGLDLRWLAYFGLVCYVGGYGLLLRTALRFAPLRTARQWCAMAILTAAYFCLTSDFAWLLVVFEYVYYAGALLVLVLFDAYARSRLRLAWMAAAFVFAALFLDSFGAVAVGSCLLLAGMGRRWRPQGFKPIGLLAFAYVLPWLVLLQVLGTGQSTASTSRAQTLLNMLSRPADVLQSLLGALAQPLVDNAALAYHLPGGHLAVQLALGLAGGTCVGWSLWSYYRRAGDEARALPALLALFALVAWALILLTRFGDFGPQVVLAQRFTRFFVPYYLAAALAIYLHPAAGGIGGRVVAAALTVLIAASFGVTAHFQFSHVGSLSAYFDRAAQAIADHPQDGGALVRHIGQCAGNYCLETIEALRTLGVAWAR